MLSSCCVLRPLAGKQKVVAVSCLHSLTFFLLSTCQTITALLLTSAGAAWAISNWLKWCYLQKTKSRKVINWIKSLTSIFSSASWEIEPPGLPSTWHTWTAMAPESGSADWLLRKKTSLLLKIRSLHILSWVLPPFLVLISKVVLCTVSYTFICLFINPLLRQ